MKRAAFLFLVTCLWNIAVQSHKLHPDERKCIEETDVSEELVMDAKKTATVPANVPEYKAFLSCCWIKYGYQHANGDMHWNVIHQVLKKDYSEKVAEKLIGKCNNIRGVTPGDTVALVLRCLDDHAPSISSLHHYYAGHHR